MMVGMHLPRTDIIFDTKLTCHHIDLILIKYTDVNAKSFLSGEPPQGSQTPGVNIYPPYLKCHVRACLVLAQGGPVGCSKPRRGCRRSMGQLTDGFSGPSEVGPNAASILTERCEKVRMPHHSSGLKPGHSYDLALGGVVVLWQDARRRAQDKCQQQCRR